MSGLYDSLIGIRDAASEPSAESHRCITRYMKCQNRTHRKLENHRFSPRLLCVSHDCLIGERKASPEEGITSREFFSKTTKGRKRPENGRALARRSRRKRNRIGRARGLEPISENSQRFAAPFGRDKPNDGR